MTLFKKVKKHNINDFKKGLEKMTLFKKVKKHNINDFKKGLEKMTLFKKVKNHIKDITKTKETKTL